MRIAMGQSLRAICGDRGMPDRATVNRWLETHREFQREYVFAREFQAEQIADQVLEIVDAEPPMVVDAYGNKRFRPGWLARQKLRAYARMWMLGRMLPRKYGRRQSARRSGID